MGERSDIFVRIRVKEKRQQRTTNIRHSLGFITNGAMVNA